MIAESGPALLLRTLSSRSRGLLTLTGRLSDRSVQPVIITNDATGYSNKLNSMMDHVWDGFYTGQKRLSRFPA